MDYGLEAVAKGVDSGMKTASGALRRATGDALKEAGVLAKAKLAERSTLVPGADARFSNWAGTPQLTSSASVRDGVLTVRPRGPWGMAEDGATPHAFGSGEHPGTEAVQGKRSWTQGQEAVFEALGTQLPERVGSAVEQAFGRV